MEDNNNKRFLDWIESKSEMQSILSIPGIGEDAQKIVDEHERYSYDSRTSSAKLCVQVQKKQCKDRELRIASVSKGDTLKLIRDPNNPDSNTITVQNKTGQLLGILPAELAYLLSPLLDEGTAELQNIQADHVASLSKSSSTAKKEVSLYVSFTVKLKKTDYNKLSGCTVCLLGGEQGSNSLHKFQAFTRNYDAILKGLWVQELRVLHCRMDAENAGLIFELYNRYCNEYDEQKNDADYFGLDNLEDEVAAARKKMRAAKKQYLDYSGPKDSRTSLIEFIHTEIEKDQARYGAVRDYFAGMEEESRPFRRVFEEDSIGEEVYYWIDQTPVSNTEFKEIEAQGAFPHWYNVAELFPPEGLPIDLADEDVVSIFGTNKFLAFADLSYGC